MEKVICSECRNEFPKSEVVTIQNAAVCAGCKPVALQRVKEGVAANAQVEYGGFWLRFGAKVIDGVVTSIAYYMLSFVLKLTLGLEGTADSPLAWINMVLSLGLGIFYSTWMVGKYSATLGKMACGLKIIVSDSTKVSYLRAFGRYFAEILSSIILYIGYIMAASDAEKRTLHDRICNTRVIKK